MHSRGQFGSSCGALRGLRELYSTQRMGIAADIRKSRSRRGSEAMQLVSATRSGALYQADCLDLLRAIPDSSVHTVFADPPFNLGKDYCGVIGSDSLPDTDYLSWCYQWLDQCCRILVPGGALFVYNLPKWLIPIGAHLDHAHMSFKHWIAIYKPTSLPIPNPGCRFPSHYGLLYYIKGDRPRFFNRRPRTRHPRYAPVVIATAILKTMEATRSFTSMPRG